MKGKWVKKISKMMTDWCMKVMGFPCKVLGLGFVFAGKSQPSCGNKTRKTSDIHIMSCIKHFSLFILPLSFVPFYFAVIGALAFVCRDVSTGVRDVFPPNTAFSFSRRIKTLLMRTSELTGVC